MLDIVVIICLVIVVMCAWLEDNYKLAMLMNLPLGMMIMYVLMNYSIHC